MATFKLLLHSANKRKDGSYPVSLRITKNMKHKYVSLCLYARKKNGTKKVSVSVVTSVSVLITRSIMRGLVNYCTCSEC